VCGVLVLLLVVSAVPVGFSAEFSVDEFWVSSLEDCDGVAEFGLVSSGSGVNMPWPEVGCGAPGVEEVSCRL
jgi:hypothetical protein